MKICFVAPANSSHIIKWCKWFTAHGHEIHVISFTPGVIEGVEIHLIDVGVDPDGSDIGKLKYLLTGRKIKKYLSMIKPDVVNVHYATSYGVATALSGLKGYILSVWGSDIYDFPKKSPLHRLLLTYSLKKAAALFSTSHAMAKEAAGYTNRRFEITPFGVDMELFHPGKRTRDTNVPFTIGIVKTLADLYGIDYILKAVAKLKKEYPEMDLALRISGDGPKADEYKQLARELGIDGITTFLGRISQQEAAQEWANMDVAVIPSILYESFGVAAVEAQASGTPVIISEVGGLMEATNPGKSSLVVPRKDAEAIADAILQLYHNPELCRQMGMEGRKNVMEKYEINHCFEQIEKSLEKQVKKNPRKQKKRCIFYLPYKLDADGKGARMLRPRKMIQAFEDIGYKVSVIEGVSSVRRKKIKEIKRKIRHGQKYDFMYTESHTEPTLLTDPNHLPTHPFLDYGFFRFVRKHGIKIGLFYCDIYWKFDNYGLELPKWKKQGALWSYRYDIRQYKKYLSKFYIADRKICSYLKEDKLTAIARELPPGAENISVPRRSYQNRKFDSQYLTIFYVGGLGNQYQLTELAKAVSKTERTRLVLCCREAEWEKEKVNFQPYLCDRIEIIHKSSYELEPYFSEADLCSLLFKKGTYIGMAKPFKAYEYLAHEIPVLSTKGTAIGEFVEENDIGWNIEYDAEAISKILERIIDDPTILDEKIEHCRVTKQSNLWISRAETVAKDLH